MTGKLHLPRVLLLLMFGIAQLVQASTSALDDRLTIARRIWEPVFTSARVDREARRPPMSREQLQQFEQVNAFFYRANAEFLDEPELLLMEKFIRTRIGSDIARAQFEAVIGGRPFTKTYKDYADDERLEFDTFANANAEPFRRLMQKMSGFVPFLRNEFIPRERAANSSNAPVPPISYPARIAAAIRPHIVIAEPIPGNPVAEVEVETLPDGQVAKIRLARSSGVAHWDAAVLRAVEKAGRIPWDADGRVPPRLMLSFRPNPAP